MSIYFVFATTSWAAHPGVQMSNDRTDTSQLLSFFLDGWDAKSCLFWYIS
jgi:hypothetical protein